MGSTMMTRTLGRAVGTTISIGVLCSTVIGQTYIMPSVGVQNTYNGACLVSTCSGTFYDSGGAGGNYAANVNAIYRTFCPSSPGMCVRATFTSFSMLDTYFLCFGPNSCCDYLQILNGPAQNSPALYSNCTTSPGTITANNASGCLTFRFVSDGTVQLPGWAATLSCVPCGIGPLGNTNADCAFATPICNNQTFSDASVGPGIVAQGCSGCNTSEVYTNWYRIQIQTSGTLAFTINPNNNIDDFDPVVYGPNVGCGSLGTPIRCSYAINAGNGNTGLGNGALDNSEDVNGNQWVAPLNVIAGQTYYILINGWSATSGTNGFALNWTGTAGLDCTILPVEFLYLRATCEVDHPLLEWATASEHNSGHFVVERSADGVKFTDIGTVNAVGNSEQLTQYLFSDPRPLDATGAFYRLRQVDLNGEVKLTEVVPLADCSGVTSKLLAVPNPATDMIQVWVDLPKWIDATARLEMLDATGRSMVQQAVNIEDGRGLAPMDLSRLGPGAYTLRLSNGDRGILEHTRVVKQ
ncbi:MAG: hypothetical protein WAU70_01120 [Flavobacteriales bacterium]